MTITLYHGRAKSQYHFEDSLNDNDYRAFKFTKVERWRYSLSHCGQSTLLNVIGAGQMPVKEMTGPFPAVITQLIKAATH